MTCLSLSGSSSYGLYQVSMFCKQRLGLQILWLRLHNNVSSVVRVYSVYDCHFRGPQFFCHGGGSLYLITRNCLSFVPLSSPIPVRATPQPLWTLLVRNPWFIFVHGKSLPGVSPKTLCVINTANPSHRKLFSGRHVNHGSFEYVLYWKHLLDILSIRFFVSISLDGL